MRAAPERRRRDVAMNAHERKRAVVLWTLAALAPAAIAALAASFAWDVEAMAAGAPWHWVGLEARACPGCGACGLSRAFAAASHLRLREAVAFNPSVLALYPLTWALALAGAVSSRALIVERRSECRPRPSC
jgi:hypothetical protein